MRVKTTHEDIRKKNMTAIALLALGALAFAYPAHGEDAYIENTEGNQYFNTGHFIGPHTRIEIDLQLLEIKGQIQPFGVKGGNDVNHPYCALYLGQAEVDGPWVWSYQASKTDYSSQAYNLKTQDAIYDAKDRGVDRWRKESQQGLGQCFCRNADISARPFR